MSIPGTPSVTGQTTRGVLNAPQLPVNGVNISSTYAMQSALAPQQDSLTVISTHVPLFSGTTVRAVAAGSNINLSVASNIITVDANLTNYALLTDLSTEAERAPCQRHRDPAAQR